MKALPKTWIVIVWPGFGISTKEAYARVHLPFAHAPLRLPAGRQATAPASLPLFNRFESLVFSDHPELPKLKAVLLKAGATAALMSGSGSAVFGLADSHASARAIHKSLTHQYPHSWVAHTI